MTPGYVPADILQLIREAATESYLRCPENPQLQLVDFQKGLKRVQPTAKREGFAQIPAFSLDNIGGLENVKQTLTTHILKPIQNPELY